MASVVRALVLTFLMLCSASMVKAQHPFYLQQLEEGRNAMVLELWEQADRHLEIAAFGLMEAPRRMAEIYVRLAILQQRLGDQEKLLKYRSRAERYLGQPVVRPPALSEPEWQSWLALVDKPITELALKPTPTADTPKAAPSPTLKFNRMAELDALIADRRYRKARKLIESALEEDPNNTDLLRRAVVFAANHDLERNAPEYARRLLDQRPEDATAHEYLGNLAAKNGETDQARRHYERVDQHQLTATDALRAQLDRPAPTATRRPRPSSRNTTAAAPETSNIADKDFDEIDRNLEAGDLNKAKKALRRMSKAHLDDPRYARAFSHYNYLKEDYQTNIRHLSGEARMLDQTRYYLGMSHYQLGDYREAEQILRRLDRERFPDLTAVDTRISQALTDTLNQPAVSNQNPAATGTEVATDLGAIAAAVNADDWKTASKAITRAYAANPTDPDVRYFRARLLLLEGQYGRASQLFYSLVNSGYRDREVYYFGGTAAKKAGDDDLASYLFDRAEVTGTAHQADINRLRGGNQAPANDRALHSPELDLLKKELEARVRQTNGLNAMLSLLRVSMVTGDVERFTQIGAKLKDMPLTREQADILQGWSLFHYGQYERAAKTVDRYQSEEALFLRGLLYHHRGLHNQALPLLGLLKGSPRFPEVDILLKQQF